MSLSNEDRAIMKQLHLDKATMFLSEADELFAMNDVVYDVSAEDLTAMQPMARELVELITQMVK